MWAELVNHLTNMDNMLDAADRQFTTLQSQHNTLTTEHKELQALHDELAVSCKEWKTKAIAFPSSEPKIPDPPMYSSDRTELIPFLTKYLFMASWHIWTISFA